MNGWPSMLAALLPGKELWHQLTGRVGGWVGLRDSLGILERRKSPGPCQGLNPGLYSWNYL